jgi:hypothetical protein
MRRILVCLALSLVPAVALAQEAKKPAVKVDTAKLTFRWPENVTARVDAERYRERHSGEKHDTIAAGASYRMTAQRTGNEYVVRFADFRLVDGVDAASPEVAAVVQRIGALMPSYRVSAAGEFTRLESPDTFRASIDSMIMTLIAKDRPPPPQLKQVMSTLTSDAVLTAAVAQEWNALVGTWAGAELEVGEAYLTEGDEPIPAFQNATVRFEYEFAALRRMSCDSVAAPGARDCVELQMVSKPDSAAMRQLLERVMGSLAPDVAKDMGFADFNVENVITLVARPESLLPVYLVVSKEVTGAVRTGGKIEKVYQLDVKSQRYTY